MHVALLVCSGSYPLSITRIHHENSLLKRPLRLAWNDGRSLTTNEFCVDLANTVPPAHISPHFDDWQVRESRELAMIF